jgi:hypothetical protein
VCLIFVIARPRQLLLRLALFSSSSLVFLDFSYLVFLFGFQWAGPGVVRVVLHVDRVTSAIVNGYPFSSFFFFCAT